MIRAGLCLAGVAVTLLLVLALPWREGGVLLQEQSRACFGLASAVLLLLLAGGGRVGGGAGPALVLCGAAYAVWHWASGTSVDGASSRESAGQLAGMACGLVVGGTVFRTAAASRVLLWAVAASASAVAVSGMIGVLRESRTVAGWTAGEGEVFAASFGPFVNPNNAAALMMTGLAAAAALLAAGLRGGGDEEESRTGEAAAAAVAAVVTAAGLLAAGSRSGVGCGLLAAVAAWGLSGPVRARTALAGGLVAAGLFYGATRLADASWVAEAWRNADRVAEDARLTHGVRMLEAVRDRPAVGWGPNTYGLVSRRYVPSDGRSWFEHADSQWFEFLVEGGAAGLLLAAAAAAALAAGVWRRRADPAAALPVAAAGGTLAALAAHSVVDNALLAGGVWVPASLVVGGGGLRRPGVGGAPLAAVAAAAAAVGAWELHAASRVQSAAFAVPPLDGPSAVAEPTVRALIRRNRDARSRRPDDGLGHWTDARLNAHLARLRLAADPPGFLSRRFGAAVWEATEPVALLALAAAATPPEREALRAHPAVEGPLRNALRSARAALEAAPLRNRALVLAAELAWLEGTPADSAAAASDAAEALPVHAPTQESLAAVAWAAGNVDLLGRTFGRAAALSDRQDDWVPALSRAYGVRRVVREILPADAAVLLRVARTQTADPADPLREGLLRRAEELVREADPDDRAAAEGRIAVLRGDPEAGEAVLRDRLREQPASPKTRRALALTLYERGEYRDALIESRAAVASDRRTPEDYQFQARATQRLRSAARR